MDLTIISTYRCNSKCSMCHIWKYPTDPSEEITPEILSKLPKGFDNVNITGGEPTLRKDLEEICDVLYPKARVLEISSNGLHPNKILPIIKKYPNTKIRFSLEGLGETNNKIRGEENGFEIKVKGLKTLQEAGGTDLGFGAVIQDDNVEELVELYRFAMKNNFEFATSALHNAFQFHKGDNFPYDRTYVARKVEGMIKEMLKTNNIKNWFRAYLNLGLIEKILGHDRLIKCTAGEDFVFIDPWSDVYLCNVRNDLLAGNLKKQTWAEITNSDLYKNKVNNVHTCTQNCWMVTTARTAMRSKMHPSLPKLKVLKWVIKNKIKVILGRDICFDDYINYSKVHNDNDVKKRNFYLGETGLKRKITKSDEPHYSQFPEYFNR